MEPDISWITCEECGGIGQTMPSGWLCTACDGNGVVPPDEADIDDFDRGREDDLIDPEMGSK